MENEISTQQAIEEFRTLILQQDSMRERVKAQKANRAPQTTNPIKIRAASAQKKSTRNSVEAGKVEPEIAPFLRVDLRERRLQEKIVKHPFLLHTPELYMGGVLMDAVVEEFRMPSGHKPDYVYLSAHNQVIRITLVEIERASAQVFNKKSRVAVFHGDTNKGIEQVREWQEWLRSTDCQKSLLISLQPLLEKYPIPLFTPAGNVGKSTQIEIGYVLVVGNEAIDTDDKQRLVDDLYIREKILFMTFPQMLAQVEQRLQHKHMIKILLRDVPVQTQGIGLPPFGDTSPDPLGVKMAGLGVRFDSTSSKDGCFHPERIREIFYRAQGRCEMPGCQAPIVYDGRMCGHFSPIYNYYPDQCKRPFSDLLRPEYTALVCNEHRVINGDEISALGSNHPMSDALTIRRPYRPDCDSQLLSFMSQWMETVSNDIVSRLKLVEGADTKLMSELRVWTRALISLPWTVRPSFQRFVQDHFAKGRYSRIDRSVTTYQRDYAFCYLMKAGLVRINRDAAQHEQIEPTILSQELIDMITHRAGNYALFALADLCSGSGYDMARQFARALEKEPV
jgi:hypothetical protein